MFELDRALVIDYQRFARSFTQIRAPNIRALVEKLYPSNRFWPDPLIKHQPAGRADDYPRQPDLFGGFMAMKEWGRIGTAGRIMDEPHPTEALAVAAMQRQAEHKRRRGYSMI